MIELTKMTNTDTAVVKIYVNPNKIVSVHSDKDGDTFIQLDNKDLFVEESVEVVISKIEAIFNRGVK